MKYDVAIIGGGTVGLTLACTLAQAGISTVLVETLTPKQLNDDRFDGRCIALAHSACSLFESIGVWPQLLPHAGPINEIYVNENNVPAFLHFGREDSGNQPMGYMVEQRFIRQALYKTARTQKHLKLICPASCIKVIYGEHYVDVTLDNGAAFQAKLLVAADGRNSPLRKKSGIKTIETDYHQSGIVCVIRHEKNHHGIAQERFLPAGPFAILPMHGGFHSSLVWTERRELAPYFMNMNDADFLEQVQQRFGDYLGALSLEGPRWCYPITLTLARDYLRPRLCLIGDAAHAIHPIAGQGFNLSLRDVTVLTECLRECKELGLDVGCNTILARFQHLRHGDNLLMTAATDGLNRLFSNNITPIKLARNLGLAAVQHLPGLKRRFVRHAMGEKI